MNLRDQLQTIYKTNKELTPRLVVDAARDASHPLHGRFEWDDSIAGEKYRQQQASELIRSVRVRYVEGGEQRDVRAFVAIPRTDEPASNYMPVEEVAADDFARTLLLKQAERDWKTLRSRYAHLREFFQLILSDLGETA